MIQFYESYTTFLNSVLIKTSLDLYVQSLWIYFLFKLSWKLLELMQFYHFKRLSVYYKVATTFKMIYRCILYLKMRNMLYFSIFYVSILCYVNINFSGKQIFY